LTVMVAGMGLLRDAVGCRRVVQGSAVLSNVPDFRVLPGGPVGLWERL
jgi:hypothetical protein